MNLIKEKAPWRRQLVARLPPLGSRVRFTVTHFGFSGVRIGVWISFSQGFFSFVLSQISFQHFSTHTYTHKHARTRVGGRTYTHTFIHFMMDCDRRGWSAFLLFIDLQYRGLIVSHPSTQLCIGHELKFFSKTENCIHSETV